MLLVDAKPSAGSSVESTGLITQVTKDEFSTFFDIDRYITNPIKKICVVSTDFKRHFISETDQPWIYQTDTKALIRSLAETLPQNVEFRPATVFLGANEVSSGHELTVRSAGKQNETVRSRFLVGADGGRSKVAELCGLGRNQRFLFGYEQVFFGNVHLGPNPEETIYHFWFGEFSLGYGGWLSPTIVEGKKAFRIGLAKLPKDRGEAKELTALFIQKLIEENIISIDGDIDKPGYVFGSMIPIGGTRKHIQKNAVLLVGDAAGYCGAFAADGIKGSVVSGKEASVIIANALKNQRVHSLSQKMEERLQLISYYKRQVRYRFIWDLMKTNRTFDAMYRIIEAERDSFLDQFCDSKDTRKSLSWVVLKWKHLPKLVRYAFYLMMDQAPTKRR